MRGETRDERVSNSKSQEVPLILHNIFTLLTTSIRPEPPNSAGGGLLTPDAFGTARLFGVKADKNHRTRCGD